MATGDSISHLTQHVPLHYMGKAELMKYYILYILLILLLFFVKPEVL